MIQRIQSVYLLIIVGLGILNCFTPIVTFTSPPSSQSTDMWQLTAFSLQNYQIEQAAIGENIPIKGLSALSINAMLIPLLALISISLFKHRIKQARLNIFLTFFCIGFYAILAVYIYFVVLKWNMDWSLTLSASIPLICAVLTLMATRLILKDEALVRSYNRLR